MRRSGETVRVWKREGLKAEKWKELRVGKR